MRRSGLTVLAVSLLTGTALAQTAGQLAEPSYAPPVLDASRSGGEVELPHVSGLQAPEGADKLFIRPSGLEVVGGFPELAKETKAIADRIRGKDVPASELFAAARELEMAYIRAGFLLVRVSLPPQKLRDGYPLKLVITDGYIERIDASALPARIRSKVEGALFSLVGMHKLTKGYLERRLLLTGDMPGLMLRSTLKAGHDTGGAVLILDGHYDMAMAAVGLSNDLSSALGTYALTFSADLNDPFGFGEVLYAHLGGYPGSDRFFSDDPRNRQIVGGFTLPVGKDSGWFNFEAVDSRTHPTSNLGYTVTDTYQRFSVKGGYTWLRSRDKNLSTYATFDVADEQQQLDLSGTRSDFTQDKLRVLRLTQIWNTFLPHNGYIGGDMSLSLGLNMFGAREATPDEGLSRDGASPDFQKVAAEVHYSQPFANKRLELKVAAKAQSSFGQPLPASEQMALSGYDWLSAFSDISIEADTGAVIRTEVALPVIMQFTKRFPNLTDAAVFYVFGAGGLAQLEQPTAVEEADTWASSVGLGVRLGVSKIATPHRASMELEYAHGEATAQDSEDAVHFRMMAKF